MAIALVQSAGNWNTGASSTTATLGAGATAGNLLVAFLSSSGTPASIITTPSGWTVANSGTDATNPQSGKIVYKVAAGGETTVACAVTGGAQTIGVEVAEFSGIVNATVDAASTPNAPGTSGTSLSTNTTGTLQTASELAFAGVGLGNGQTLASQSWDSSFVKVAHGDGTSQSALTAYLITSGTTALNPTATWSTSQRRVGMIATFMQAKVDTDLTLVWGESAQVDSDLTLAWGESGPATSDLTLNWSEKGPLAPGWYVTTEVAWRNNPLTRPLASRTVTDGVLNSTTTVTSATAAFTSADIGSIITASGIPANAYITAVGSATSVTISAAATATASSVNVTINAWTILAEGLKSLTIKRGTKILSSGIEAGTATAVLSNEARNLDPDYALSPYAPHVIPRRRIRFVLRDAGGNVLKVLHTGFIERYQRSWALDTAYVTLPTQDLFGVISGANLPISVLDYVTQQLGPDAYYPLGDAAGATVSPDEMGNNGFAAYNLPLQASGLLTNYDTRQGMTCARPTGSNLASQNIVRFPYSVPQSVTVAGWFRHIPGDDVAMNPTILTLQDGGGVPFTFTGSTGHYGALVSIKHTTGNNNGSPGIVVRDPSNYSGWISTLSYPMLDGNPHFLVASINGSTKALTLWFDGVNQGALTNSTGVGLASINVSSMLSNVNMFAAGWGIVWDSANTDNNQANVGQCSVFQRILTDAEVLSMWNAGSTAWDNDRADVRLGKVCDLIGIDPADRNFDVGTQTCGPTILGAQNGLSYIKKIIATEQGSFFVNGDQLRFTARPSLTSVKQVFSDDPVGDGGAPAEAWQPDFGWDLIVNTLTASVESGTTRVVQDAVSAQTYGPLSGTVGGKIDTLARSIDAAVSTTQWVINGHKTPTSYVPAVKVSSADTGVSQDALLNVEVADQVSVIGRPPSPTVSPISMQAQVEHVQYDFPNPTEMTTTYSPLALSVSDISDGESASVVPTDISDGGNAASPPTDISDGGNAFTR